VSGSEKRRSVNWAEALNTDYRRQIFDSPTTVWSVLAGLVIAGLIAVERIGSLYPALYRLEQQGLIRAAWESTENGRRAKVYSLTAAGRKRLAGQREAWRRFSGALAAIPEQG
jgi:hypothetical protein